MSGTYVALDLEATGMDPERDEIIEIAAITFRDDRILERWESLIRPQGSIPFNITSLTGIGAKDVRRAPVFSAVAPRLRDFVRNYPIVGQSPQLDIEMLAGAGLRLQNPLYDTFQLATILMPDLPAYNLATIADRLGISVPYHHRAMADVETTMGVFLGLMDLLKGYDAETVSRLMQYARTARSPLAQLFAGVHREIVSDGLDALSGSSIAAQLMAKVGGVSQGHDVLFLFQRERPARLEQTGRRDPLDPGRLREWAEPGGALARAFPGYEPRSQQMEMMTAVMGALNNEEQLLVEAGTGTGKSLAYLLPSILQAVARGEPVVISTNTIALQDQLFRKDLPDLRRAIGIMAKDHPELKAAANFEAALVKGRGNYLCLRRWFMAERDAPQTPEEAALHAKVLTWVQQTETGDRAELHLSQEEQALWPRLAEEEGSCVPGRCVFHRRNQCFLFRARYKAESAHIIVVNHALLLSDMLASNKVLPTYQSLIVDEAHNLEEEATAQFSFSVGRSRLIEFINRCVGTDESGGSAGILGTLERASRLGEAEAPGAQSLADGLQPRLAASREAAISARSGIELVFQRLTEFIDRYQEERNGYDRRVRLTPGIRHDAGWSEVELFWEDVAEDLRQVLQTVRWSAVAMESLSEEELPDHDEIATELDLLLRTGHDLLDQALSAISEPHDDIIYWLSRQPVGGDVSIRSAPLHVGGVLKERLFDRCKTVVLTSATLTTDGSFEYIRSRLGIEQASELQVASPFDYPRSTLLYLTDDIPEPGQPGYQRHLQTALIELCRATRGRAMVLFTSHSALQATYRAIKRPLESEGILVLGQRLDGSPRQLVERLKGHPETVLLGTNSFWEGVDVVGDALSLLVISKLPFSVPSDPIFAARSELFDEPFQQYAIPQAVLRFKQGFGRLIRSSTDRGVCAILDRRMVSRRYGQSFVHSLPDCTVEVGRSSDLPSRAAGWLRQRDVEAAVGSIP